MRERAPRLRTHSFRNFLLAVVGVPAVSLGGSYAYIYQDAGDKADTALSNSVKGFAYLATAPDSQQATNRFELTPNTSLLLNSIGAWVIDKSAIPEHDGTVRLHVHERQDLIVTSIATSRQAKIAVSNSVPKGVTDITLVSPTIYGAQCSSDHTLTIQELDVSYQGKPYELTSLRLPDQCNTANGLHGNGVTVHGIDYGGK